MKKKQRRLPKVLSNQEQNALLKSFDQKSFSGHRDYLICKLILHTGLRISEVLNLSIDNIFDDGTVFVHEGKGKKDRYVFISESFVNELREFYENCLIRKPGTRFLFVSRNGKPIIASHLRRKLKALKNKINLKKDLYPHLLRHSFATDLYTKTNDLFIVKEALGHSRIETTVIYTHINNDKIKKAMVELRKDGEKC